MLELLLYGCSYLNDPLLKRAVIHQPLVFCQEKMKWDLGLLEKGEIQISSKRLIQLKRRLRQSPRSEDS